MERAIKNDWWRGERELFWGFSQEVLTDKSQNIYFPSPPLHPIKVSMTPHPIKTHNRSLPTPHCTFCFKYLFLKLNHKQSGANTHKKIFWKGSSKYLETRTKFNIVNTMLELEKYRKTILIATQPNIHADNTGFQLFEEGRYTIIFFNPKFRSPIANKIERSSSGLHRESVLTSLREIQTFRHNIGG